MADKEGKEFKMSCIKREMKEDSPKRTIPGFIKYWAETKPEKEIVVFLAPNGAREAVTWRSIYENSVRYAKAFIKLGVKKDDVVAMIVKCQPTWLYINFGLMFAGAIPFPLVIKYKDGSDIIECLNKVGSCTTMVLDPDYDSTTWQVVNFLLTSSDNNGNMSSQKIPSLKKLVCTSLPVEDRASVITMETLLQSVDLDVDIKLPDISYNSVAFLLQSSGSTGAPKSIAHTHSSVDWCIGSILKFHYAEESSRKSFNTRPFCWAGGWPYEIFCGVVRVCGFQSSEEELNDPEYVINSIQMERCTAMYSVPLILNGLIEKQDFLGENWPLKYVTATGQPITKKFAKACLGKLCSRLVYSYGSTEAACISSHMVADENDIMEYSCGYPHDGVEMKLVDDEGQVVPVNTAGEIYLKSPGMFAGYFGDPEKTKAAFDADGWFKTDDIGQMAADGRISIQGRKSDIILSAGFTIMPSTVERTMISCPGIKSIAIVPVPDELYFQLLCACVIPEDRMDVTEDSIRSYCEDLHNYKEYLLGVMPSYYLFYDQFPKTSTGKPDRRALTADAKRRIEKLPKKKYRGQPA